MRKRRVYKRRVYKRRQNTDNPIPPLPYLFQSRGTQLETLGIDKNIVETYAINVLTIFVGVIIIIFALYVFSKG